ncbi:hypothetical protein [Enterobacter chengduensis]|uniref:hypothetical protein n=1 Tax=Enterobacter chengduensis TaxID=2494701 RepID=UPI000B4E226B|nr:hypothetical protein [Enterobacter chengduensis]MDL0064797.1 hypothetical protein [Enterobacter chengduensis]PNL54938.1 hypothetical protein CEP65_019910 [Enterobacter hormaechei]
MKKLFMTAIVSTMLIGCTPPKIPVQKDQRLGNRVTIFAADNLLQAQARADQLCGAHAFFVIDLRSDSTSTYGDLYGIRYNCNLEEAAIDGSAEARKIQHDKEVEGYKEYVRTTENIKEERRKRAAPNKYESYTETDSYGNVRTYSFFNGQTCEASVTAEGAAQTHCE